MPPRSHTPRPGDPTKLALALSHEVGNLLAAARLSAYLVARETGTAQGRACAEDVEAVSVQAGALLAHLRPLLEPDGGSRLHVDPAELLEAVERGVAPRAPNAPEVVVEAAADLPDVRVDADALHHLLVTLVLSAWDAAPAGSRVRVCAERARRGGGVVFCVEDAAPRYRPDKADPRVGPRGRGLVLEVAATLLERWDGRVRVVPGERGTRVELRLPAADGEEGA